MPNTTQVMAKDFIKQIPSNGSLYLLLIKTLGKYGDAKGSIFKCEILFTAKAGWKDVGRGSTEIINLSLKIMSDCYLLVIINFSNYCSSVLEA